MKILLIEQLRTRKTSYKAFEKIMLTSFSILPTLYMRRLAAITPKKHHITLINERYEPVIYSDDFDIVVIHFTTASANIAYETADNFKRLNVPVILCGLHASAMPNEGLKHADSILMGRGEANWITLLKDAEINSLKQKYDPKPYESLSKSIPPTNVRLPGFQLMGAIEATRGCPYLCSFCPESNTPNGSHYYKRSITEIIEEIKKAPQRIIMFYDASLTIDPVFTKKLFKQMIPLKKKFFCNGNVDVLSKDDELIELSKQAGCIGWLIGFESISQKTIDSVNKKTNTVSIYKQAIDHIHLHKMMVIGDFMFGFDTDTKDVFQTTVKTIIGLGIDVADFTIVTPFPGTPFYEELKKQNRITSKNWNDYTMYSVVYQPKQMNKEELIDGIYDVYRRFYAPKNTLLRILKGARFGFYPFFSILSRNFISMIASTKIRN
ncbi:MAG: hypothetical protein DRN27_03335 [Thermoplasmata archaeon]|nr:MAG: hypothetical protein DRN27_03335 [Thermoplasmata archaeon]